MNCKKAEKIILKYTGNSMPENKKKYLDRHLSRCDRCRAYKQKSVQLLKVMDSLEISAKAPEGFTRRVLARVGVNEEPVRRSIFPGKFIYGAIAGAAAAAILFFTLLPRQVAPEEVYWMASETTADSRLAGYRPNSRFYSGSSGYIKVNLRSAEELEGVTVNIDLPEGLELYDGGRSIENWKVDLNRGDNVVFLRVKPRFRGVWSVEGVLEKDGATSSFSKDIEVL